MTATLPVSELEAQIHALSYEDKLRIASFAQREVSAEASLDDEPPQWVKDELLRREKLVEEGKMEMGFASIFSCRPMTAKLSSRSVLSVR
jgi:hypothetical protein